MYTIDENGYGWRQVLPPPFFGTYRELLQLFAVALMAKIYRPHVDRKRRLGSHPRRPKRGVPGSRLKRYAGPMSYDAWKAEEAAKRAAKRASCAG